MTCIIGVVGADGSVTMGADSAGSNGWTVSTRKDTKLFRRGEFLIGCTTSFRMIQLLQYKLNVPAQRPGVTDHEFMATEFVDAVRTLFTGNGFAHIQNNKEEGGTFLVGYRGQLYVIESDYQVGVSADGYASVGCGYQVASGAMCALRACAPALSDTDHILNALTAAEYFSLGVRSPFCVEKLVPPASAS